MQDEKDAKTFVILYLSLWLKIVGHEFCEGFIPSSQNSNFQLWQCFIRAKSMCIQVYVLEISRFTLINN